MLRKAMLGALVGASLIIIPSAALAHNSNWDDEDEDDYTEYSQPNYEYDDTLGYPGYYDNSYDSGYGGAGFSITFGTGSGYYQPDYYSGYGNTNYYENDYDRDGYSANRNQYYRNRHHYRNGRCGSGTTGAIVGGAIGAVVGQEIERSGNDDRYGYRSGGATGAIVGGAAGALAGHAIGKNC